MPWTDTRFRPTRRVEKNLQSRRPAVCRRSSEWPSPWCSLWLAALPVAARAQSLDTVVTWNRIMLDAVVAPGANPPTVFVHRPMAIVSIAVFDAANSFDRLYQPYATSVDPAPGASRDAAVAQAAHDTLVGAAAQPTRYLRRRPRRIAGRHPGRCRARGLTGGRRRGEGHPRTPGRMTDGVEPRRVPPAAATRLLAADAARELGRDVHPLSRRRRVSSSRAAGAS